jgi:DNA-binding protein HU-beta
MTKSQLVTKLADDGGLSRKPMDGLVNDLVHLRKMNARVGRNPQTGEEIEIPARKQVGFSVAKEFKESVLGKR